MAAKCPICQSIYEKLAPAEWDAAQTAKPRISLTIYMTTKPFAPQDWPVKLLGVFILDLDPDRILQLYDFHLSNREHARCTLSFRRHDG